MPVVVVHGVESSVTRAGAPTYQDIANALDVLTAWIGPRPRVVRSLTSMAMRAFVTQVAWPYQWPDTVTREQDAANRAQLLAAVQRALGALSSDWVITIEPYSIERNGPLSWWQLGTASVTRTADTFPELGGRVDADENPIGPTTDLTHPTTIAGIGQTAADFFDKAKPFLLVGLGLYLADKIGIFDAIKRPQRVRSNPSENWWEDMPELPSDARSNPDFSRILAANARPPEWDQFAPSTRYPCRPYESALVGVEIPGRGGGVVTSCATPSEPKTSKRRKGQVGIGLPGIGGTMPKSRARGRLRRVGMEILKTPLEQVAQASAAYRSERCPLPWPTGIEFPHIASKCDMQHPLWKGYEDALDDARERASMMAEDAGPEEFECIVRETLAEDPRFPKWDEAASKCARGFAERESTRKGKAQFSQRRETAQARAGAIARGEDVTSAHYTDTLRSAEHKPKKGRKR